MIEIQVRKSQAVLRNNPKKEKQQTTKKRPPSAGKPRGSALMMKKSTAIVPIIEVDEEKGEDDGDKQSLLRETLMAAVERSQTAEYEDESCIELVLIVLGQLCDGQYSALQVGDDDFLLANPTNNVFSELPP